MANLADSTAAFELHDLSGSTPPGAGTPDFGPIAGEPVRTRPRPHSETGATFASFPAGERECTMAYPPRLTSWTDDVGSSSYDEATHPERDLIAACGDATNKVIADNREQNGVTETAAAVREASATVADLSPRTPEGLAAQATFLFEILFPQNKVDPLAFARIGDHIDCVFSLLDNARWIGSCSRFTIAHLVGLEADPPVRAPAEGWAFHHLMQDWAWETLNNDALDEMFDRIEDKQPSLVPDAGLFVKVEDAKLFKLPIGGRSLRNLGRIYDGRPQLDALARILSEDDPNLSAEANEARRARAAEILGAHAQFRKARDDQERELGIAQNRRAAHWRDKTEAGLRQRILSTPVSTLDGLIAKTVVYADCCGSPFQQTLEELEDDLIKENLNVGASNTTFEKAIILDLFRIMIASNKSMRSVAGMPERRHSTREPAASAAQVAA